MRSGEMRMPALVLGHQPLHISHESIGGLTCHRSFDSLSHARLLSPEHSVPDEVGPLWQRVPSPSI
jgi:hypothetical protein